MTGSILQNLYLMEAAIYYIVQCVHSFHIYINLKYDLIFHPVVYYLNNMLNEITSVDERTTKP